MEITTQVCDLDPIIGQPVKRYDLTISDGRTYELDLCADHAEAIELLVERVLARSKTKPAPVTRLVPAKKVAKKAPSGRRGSRAVKSLDEIEREKA